jgi:hypothetical protein
MRIRIYSGSEGVIFGHCILVGPEAHAADWITFVRLFMARSISWGNLRLT